MGEYPEHDKLSAVSAESQAQGELLEWLAGQGVELMVWREWDEEQDCDSEDHRHPGSYSSRHCYQCDGSLKITRHYARHVPWGRSILTILADFNEIDLSTLEREKRAMLDSLRTAGAG